MEILEEGVAEGVFRQDLDPEVDAAFIRERANPGRIAEETSDIARLAGATVRFVLTAVSASQHLRAAAGLVEVGTASVRHNRPPGGSMTAQLYIDGTWTDALEGDPAKLETRRLER